MGTEGRLISSSSQSPNFGFSSLLLARPAGLGTAGWGTAAACPVSPNFNFSRHLILLILYLGFFSSFPSVKHPMMWSGRQFVSVLGMTSAGLGCPSSGWIYSYSFSPAPAGRAVSCRAAPRGGSASLMQLFSRGPNVGEKSSLSLSSPLLLPACLPAGDLPVQVFLPGAALNSGF